MTLYLDTSSLVKLYIAEPGSELVRELVDHAVVVATSAIAYPETRAALARRRREGVLTSAVFAMAKRMFERDWPKCLAVDASASICRAAGKGQRSWLIDQEQDDGRRTGLRPGEPSLGK